MKLLYKRILLWSILILHIILIFSFSVQNAEESTIVSRGFTKKIRTTEKFEEKIRGQENDDGKISERSVKLLAQRDFLRLEAVLRKTAHITLFFILGLIINFLISAYGIKRLFCALISPVFALSVGFFDETIQLFSAGRAGSVGDVFIDFSGAVIASVLFFVGGKIYEKTKEKRIKMDS